ncbi:MAG: hypothetical protein Q7T01_00255 [bacterium]|nr:hypothetical protein [bacterium]
MRERHPPMSEEDRQRMMEEETARAKAEGRCCFLEPIDEVSELKRYHIHIVPQDNPDVR